MLHYVKKTLYQGYVIPNKISWGANKGIGQTSRGETTLYLKKPNNAVMSKNERTSNGKF